MISAAFGLGYFALVVLLTAVALRLWPGLARAVIGTDPPDRHSSLDGLRGMLAVSVILHHAIITRAYCQSSRWRAPAANFDNLAGQGAVALFFMTSAYLFWGRIVRTRAVDWNALYRGRIRRLVPMYATALLVVFAAVAVETGFTLRVPFVQLIRQLLQWLSFGMMESPDINGLPDTITIQSVLWTLRYEWLFYLALPLFAYFYGALRQPWPLYLAVGALAAGFDSLQMVLYFVSGGIAVHAVARWRESPLARRIGAGVGALALVALVALHHDAFALQPALLLFPVFVAALLASGPWALLRWRPLRYLGHISYSVYLLHNPIIHLVSIIGFGRAAFAGLSTWQMYGALIGIAALTIAVSTVTYLFIRKAGSPRDPLARRGHQDKIRGHDTQFPVAAAWLNSVWCPRISCI